MKTKLLLVVIMVLMFNFCWGKNQKFIIFGTSISANEITGGNYFNDLGVLITTSIINNLTDDKATYLWRLGSVRIDALDFKGGNIPLFDLAYSNPKKGYPILDEIDFNYFCDWGFNIWEARDSTILTDSKYLEFRNSFKDINLDIEKKRIILWDDNNLTFKNKLFATKYVENIQQVRDTVTKKITNNLAISLNFNLNSLAIFADSLGIDSANTKFISHLNEKINKTISLKGYFISATFNYRYIDYINEYIQKLDTIIKNDNKFNSHLFDYFYNTNLKKLALNSALFAFKFNGELNFSKFDTTSINASLGVRISPSIKAKIITYIKEEYSKQFNQTITNSFSKVWIIGFGTDAILNGLHFKKTKKLNNSK